MGRTGELDGGALVGDGEALGVQDAERTLRVGRFGAGGSAVPDVDRGAGSGHRRAIVTVQRDILGQVELVGVLQEHATFGMMARQSPITALQRRPTATYTG